MLLLFLFFLHCLIIFTSYINRTICTAVQSGIHVFSKGYCPSKGRCILLTFRPTSDLFRCGSDIKTFRTKCVVYKSKVEHQECFIFFSLVWTVDVVFEILTSRIL